MSTESLPVFWGYFCSSGNEFCPYLLDKYCKKYQQELMFDGNEYERCSRCLRCNFGSDDGNGSFMWAVSQIYRGEKVKRVAWPVADRVYLKDGVVIAYKSFDGSSMSIQGYSFRINDIIESDWVIVK